MVSFFPSGMIAGYRWAVSVLLCLLFSALLGWLLHCRLPILSGNLVPSVAPQSVSNSQPRIAVTQRYSDNHYASSSHTDTRSSALHNKVISTSYIYKLLTFMGISCISSSWTWDPIIPLKYRIFLWLTFRGRLNSRDNMVKKHWTSITPHQDCDICPASESINHIVLCCFPAPVLWGALHMFDLAANSTDLINFMQEALQVWSSSSKIHIMFVASAVTLWDARNDWVFNDKRWSPAFIKQYAAQLLCLWQNRTRKPEDRDAIAAWVQWLIPS